MELDYLHVFRTLHTMFLSHLKDILRSRAGHVKPYHVDAGVWLVALESGLEISVHRLPNYLYCLTLETVLDNGFFAHEDGTCSTIRCRAALQLGQWLVNHTRIFDFIQRVRVAELGVRVVHTVAVILLPNLSVMLRRGTIQSHVLTSSVAKYLGHGRGTI